MKIWIVIKYFAVYLAFAAITGCTTLQATKVPGADTSQLKSIYVQTQLDDNRDVAKSISDQLNLIGYKSTFGPSESMPANVDAILTYQDEWKWDMTMYLFELSIQLWDSKTRNKVAFGMSRKTSLARKDPDAMAKEILIKVLQSK